MPENIANNNTVNTSNVLIKDSRQAEEKAREAEKSVERTKTRERTKQTVLLAIIIILLLLLCCCCLIFTWQPRIVEDVVNTTNNIQGGGGVVTEIREQVTRIVERIEGQPSTTVTNNNELSFPTTIINEGDVINNIGSELPEGNFVFFIPESAQTTTSTNNLINVESNATGATNPLVVFNENGTGNPDLLQLQVNSSPVALFNNNGQLQLATQGINGGLLIGGDVEFYRSGSDSAVLGASLNPSIDNAFDLGGINNRWNELSAGPLGLTLTSTPGNAGSGADYTSANVGFSGGSLVLSTQNNGAATGGAIGLESALPSGAGATSAFDLQALNDLGSTDSLFRLGDSNNNNFINTVGNGDTTHYGRLGLYDASIDPNVLVNISNATRTQTSGNGRGMVINYTNDTSGASAGNSRGIQVNLSSTTTSEAQTLFGYESNVTRDGTSNFGTYGYYGLSKVNAGQQGGQTAGGFFGAENYGTIWPGSNRQVVGSQGYSLNAAGATTPFASGGTLYTDNYGTVANVQASLAAYGQNYDTGVIEGFQYGIRNSLTNRGSVSSETSGVGTTVINSGTSPLLFGDNLDVINEPDGQTGGMIGQNSDIFNQGTVSGDFGFTDQFAGTLRLTGTGSVSHDVRVLRSDVSNGQSVGGSFYGSQINFENTFESDLGSIGGSVYGHNFTVNNVAGSTIAQDVRSFNSQINNGSSIGDDYTGLELIFNNNHLGNFGSVAGDAKGQVFTFNNDSGTVSGDIYGSDTTLNILNGTIGGGLYGSNLNVYNNLSISDDIYGSRVNVAGSGSAVNTYGSYIDNQIAGSVNNYGLYINGVNEVGSGNNYSLYVNSGDSYFNGGVRVGNTSNDIAGMIRWSGSDFEGYDGSNWLSLTLGGGGGNYVNFEPGIPQNSASADPLIDLNYNGAAFAGNGLISLTSNGTDQPSLLYIENQSTQILELQSNGDLILGQGGIQLGNSSNTTEGMVRWTGTDFEGYDGSTWVSLTSGLGGGCSSCIELAPGSPQTSANSGANVVYTNNATVTDYNAFTITNNNSGTADGLVGGSFVVNNADSGTGGFVNNDISGLLVTVDNVDGNVLGNIYGARYLVTGNVAASDSYGLYVENQGVGTNTNYGIYVAEPFGGSQNYSIYTAGGDAFFAAGGLKVDNTSNAVEGMIRWTGTDFEGYDGSIWQSLTAGGGGGAYVNFADVNPQDSASSDPMINLNYIGGAFSGDGLIRLTSNGTDQPSLIYVENQGTEILELTSAGDLEVSAGGLLVSDTLTAAAGMIRWTGADFEGYDGLGWNSFTSGGGGCASCVEFEPVSAQVSTGTTELVNLVYGGGAFTGQSLFSLSAAGAGDDPVLMLLESNAGDYQFAADTFSINVDDSLAVGNNRALESTLSIDAGNSAGSANAYNFYLTTNVNADQGNAFGIRNDINVADSTTTLGLNGIRNNLYVSGTANNVYNFLGRAEELGGGQIDNYYGLRLETPQQVGGYYGITIDTGNATGDSRGILMDGLQATFDVYGLQNRFSNAGGVYRAIRLESNTAAGNVFGIDSSGLNSTGGNAFGSAYSDTDAAGDATIFRADDVVAGAAAFGANFTNINGSTYAFGINVQDLTATNNEAYALRFGGISANTNAFGILSVGIDSANNDSYGVRLDGITADNGSTRAFNAQSITAGADAFGVDVYQLTAGNIAFGLNADTITATNGVSYGIRANGVNSTNSTSYGGYINAVRGGVDAFGMRITDVDSTGVGNVYGLYIEDVDGTQVWLERQAGNGIYFANGGAESSNDIVTQDGLLNVAGAISLTDGLIVSNSSNTTAGMIRWTGTDFEGYDGSAWDSFTLGGGGGCVTCVEFEPASAQSSSGTGELINLAYNGGSFTGQALVNISASGASVNPTLLSLQSNYGTYQFNPDGLYLETYDGLQPGNLSAINSEIYVDTGDTGAFSIVNNALLRTYVNADQNQVVAVQGTAELSDAITLGRSTGFRSDSNISGNVTDVYGFLARAEEFGSGVIDNYLGLRVEAPSQVGNFSLASTLGASSTGESKGLWLENLTATGAVYGMQMAYSNAGTEYRGVQLFQNEGDGDVYGFDSNFLTSNSASAHGLAANNITAAADATVLYSTNVTAGSVAYGVRINNMTAEGDTFGSRLTDLTSNTASTRAFSTADLTAADAVFGLDINILTAGNNGYGINVDNLTATNGSAYGMRTININSTNSDSYGMYVSQITGSGVARGIFSNDIESTTNSAYGIDVTNVRANQDAFGVRIADVDTTDAGDVYGLYIQDVNGTQIYLERQAGSGIFFANGGAEGADDIVTEDATLNVNGAINMTGVCADSDGGDGGSDGCDVAETFASTESLQKGEIVMLDPNAGSDWKKIVRTTNKGVNAIGIVSTNPTIIMGNNPFENSRSYPVGLAGVLPTKVVDQNGLIQRGDYVTVSDTPGRGMKANAGESTVGIAMEDQKSANDTINVLVSRNSGGSADLTAISDRITNLENEIATLKGQSAEVVTEGGASIDMVKLGLAFSLTDFIKVQDGVVAIDGKLNVGELITDKLTISGQRAGDITLAIGEDSATQNVAGLSAASRVVVTPNGALPDGASYWIEKLAGKFTIKLSTPATSEIKFDYIVIEN